ncbi:hypothetical protein GCM10010977_20610 [Citricoccus zhacaiensis]|uniref:Secreted peptide n=1 Tax=Citricoccus zhacaiensis TaxID=489142 RepID=A0ABQ2M231_9MICC|nr:hypothetical protein GCM10010977_20610 [Citricoccus zhacaiensis]
MIVHILVLVLVLVLVLALVFVLVFVLALQSVLVLVFVGHSRPPFPDLLSRTCSPRLVGVAADLPLAIWEQVFE